MSARWDASGGWQQARRLSVHLCDDSRGAHVRTALGQRDELVTELRVIPPRSVGAVARCAGSEASTTTSLWALLLRWSRRRNSNLETTSHTVSVQTRSKMRSEMTQQHVTLTLAPDALGRLRSALPPLQPDHARAY